MTVRGDEAATLTTRFRAYGDRMRVTVPGEARTDAFSDGCPGR